MLTIRPQRRVAHARQETLRHQEHAVEIDRHDPPPIGEADLLERLRRDQPGIVHENVAAAKRLADARAELGDAVGVGDIAAQRDGAAARRFDGPQGRVAGLNVGDDDGGALRGEPDSMGLADARGGAGDDGDFVGVPLLHAISPDRRAATR